MTCRRRSSPGLPKARVLALALALPLNAGLGCTEVECATPDFTRAECRVLAENQFARLRTSTGVELRVQAPQATGAETWIAGGLIRERGDRVRARVAGLGDFALSIDNPSEAEVTVALELANVHPQALLRAGPAGAEQPTSDVATGTKRSLELTIPPGELWWVRGTLPCAPVVRVAALADIQTNPTQFARIIDRIREEADEAEAAGELLAGVLVAGDLTESSSEEEFRVFTDLLEPVAVPFALTPGNHDIYRSHVPSYNQTFGPGNYAFELCGVHVAMLDTGSGAIAASVAGRLHELFDPGDAPHSLAVMHHPPYAELTSAGWSSEALAQITLGEFAYQGGDLLVTGHAHMLRDFPKVPVAGAHLRELIVGTAGAWQGAGDPIYGYVRLTFTTEDMDVCFVEVPPPGALPSDSLPGDFERCTSP